MKTPTVIPFPGKQPMSNDSELLCIVGAGMAGLLAANILHRRNPLVIERQSGLPNNHSALLRFRSDAVGRALGIPFKKVRMIKTAMNYLNPAADALLYSKKCTGQYTTDRSITDGDVVGDRWIAPLDLIPQMANGVTISYDSEFTFKEKGPAVISTIPMPALMTNLNYPDAPNFKFIKGVTVTADIADCDAYVTLLVPDPDLPYSRISITGSQLILEFPRRRELLPAEAAVCVASAVAFLGVAENEISNIEVKQQMYYKILPIADEKRKAFMHWASVKYNIYSLGRFATWRPGLLLDDLLEDIQKIDQWITKGTLYDFARSI